MKKYLSGLMILPHWVVLSYSSLSMSHFYKIALQSNLSVLHSNFYDSIEPIMSMIVSIPLLFLMPVHPGVDQMRRL